MSTTTTPDRALSMIPVSKIKIREGHNPRGAVDRKSEAFKELVASVKQDGVLQPILVAPPNGDGAYTVIAGHRRHAAAADAKLKEIPAMVAELGDREFVAAVVENLQREDLSPLQEARALEQLRQGGMKQAEAAKVLGKSERWARERQRLLNVPEKVQEAVDAGDVPLEAIPVLEKIAKASPAAAEKVTALGVREGKDLADNAALVGLLERVASTCGLQGETGYWGVAPSGLAVLSADRKELAQLHKELPKPPYGNKPGFRFGEAEHKAAKAKGSVLELTYERWNAPAKAWFITDPELTAELARKGLPALRKHLEEQVAQHEKHRGGQGNADREKQREREEGKRKREAEQFAKANAELGEQLGKLGNLKATDVDVVRMVCAMALGAEDYLDEMVGESLGEIGVERYQYPPDDEEVDASAWPGNRIVEDLAAAKTAGECLAIVARLAIAARCQLTHTHRYWMLPGPDDPGRLDTGELVDNLASKLDILPPAAAKAAKARQAEREKTRKQAEQAAKRAAGKE